MTLAQGYDLSALWGPRPASLEESAAKVVRFLLLIQELGAGQFGRWYELGYSRSEALSRRVQVEEQAIREFMASRVQPHTDRGLGFRIGLWNGAADDDEAIGLSICCGLTFRSLSNACVIGLPRLRERTVSLLTTSTLVQLTRGIVDVFDPDRVRCFPMLDEAPVGWLHYLRARPSDLPQLPAEIHGVGPGALIVKTNEPFSTENPEHRERARAIADALREAGLM